MCTGVTCGGASPSPSPITPPNDVLGRGAALLAAVLGGDEWPEGRVGLPARPATVKMSQE